MAYKTFISYKYSEAQTLRDRIIVKLGTDATYYQGETSDSPDLTDLATETIKSHLKEMLFDTTVTIVIVSPNMRESKWIPWEVEYSLRNYERGGRESHTNGIVGVVMKNEEGSTEWAKEWSRRICFGAMEHCYKSSMLPDIIANNRANRKQPLHGSDSNWPEMVNNYISLIDEEEFLKNPAHYINHAYCKSKSADEYDLCKTR